jgi:LytR cell envelope-related transcriptional attenuator
MSFARVRALVVVGVLAVAAVVFVIVALVRDTQHDTVASGCPKGSVMADVTLPDDSDQVTVKVYNGTNKANLAEAATNDFKNRGFKTQKPAESRKKFTGVAQLRYGPAAVGKAHLLKAYFLAQAEAQYNPKRKGDLVDVVLGSKYLELATQTEVNQSLVELGEPKVPPGACAAPPKKAAKQQ